MMRSSPSLRLLHRSEAGYNLVILVMVITVMNIVIAASLPLWSSVIRRDKEEELIFRGLQYAEAIRVFQNRFGRLPVRLEELVEVKPRSIRQLWKEPMSDNGKWDPIFQNQPMAPVQPQSPGGDPTAETPNGPPGGDSGEGDGREKPTFGGPAKGDTVAVGPIIGVRSRSGKPSFLIFNGKQRYDEWQFTINLLNQRPAPVPPPGGFNEQAMGQGSIDLSTRWIGRPLPPYLTLGVQQPQDGQLPVDPMMRGTDPNQRRPGAGRRPGGTRSPR